MVTINAKLKFNDKKQLISTVPKLKNHKKSYINPIYKKNETLKFVTDDDVVPKNIMIKDNVDPTYFFHEAGPRKNMYWDPSEINAAIVTCGGICPGINTVIRELVYTLNKSYGVDNIYGIQNGFEGLYNQNLIKLYPSTVKKIHHQGGTIIGSSRSSFDIDRFIEYLMLRNINHLYVIGGNGTHKGTAKIAKVINEKQIDISIVGIPKTIDNDISIIDKSFGFDTAVNEAQNAIKSAYNEINSFSKGVGIVKMMGRESGFIAMYSSLASRNVDCCLIPEVDFVFHGEHGLLSYVNKKLSENDYILIVVAEGTKNPFTKKADTHIEDLLIKTIKENIKGVCIKYIDPTYMIRSVPAIASDNIYCTKLAQSAVHMAFAGYTGFLVGPVNGIHCIIPINNAINVVNMIDPKTSSMWYRLITGNQQPTFTHLI